MKSLEQNDRNKEDLADSPRSVNAGLDELQPGDFYLESNNLVFTAQYHLRRGYCCNSGCRHCPYQ